MQGSDILIGPVSRPKCFRTAMSPVQSVLSCQTGCQAATVCSASETRNRIRIGSSIGTKWSTTQRDANRLHLHLSCANWLFRMPNCNRQSNLEISYILELRAALWVHSPCHPALPPLSHLINKNVRPFRHRSSHRQGADGQVCFKNEATHNMIPD